MAFSKSNSILRLSKRTFTTERVPVATILGQKLIFGNDSNDVVKAVREVAKHGGLSTKITLKTKISDLELTELEKSK